MNKITNKDLSNKITEIEDKLPNGEIVKIQKNISEIRTRLKIIKELKK